jgi:hypothetical protein
MKKIIHIGAWFIGHLLFAGLLVVILVLATPPEMYPHLFRRGVLAGYMADFSRRSFNYRISSHDSSLVIVGPSYAAAVGEAEGVHNLGLAMAGIGHIKTQVAMAKPGDTPVFFLSVRDLVPQPTGPHPYNNRLMWFPYIAKCVDISLSGVRPAPRWATPTRATQNEADFMHFCKKLSNGRTTINLGLLSEMREINSNIIFALTPVRLDNDWVVAAHDELKDALSQKGLDYIDLSHLLKDDAFYDRHHFKKESQEVVMAALRRQVSL